MVVISAKSEGGWDHPEVVCNDKDVGEWSVCDNTFLEGRVVIKWHIDS